jgi:hypothetical protein
MMKDTIRAYLLGRSHVSFAELSHQIAGFSGGPCALTMANPKGGERLILWADMTDESVLALQELHDEGFYGYEGCTPLVYLIDGAVPRIPPARQFRAYKDERWLPVTLTCNHRPH